MSIDKEKLENFFDFVMGEGLTVSEVLELVKLYACDYRDGILEQEQNKNKVTLAINMIRSAQKMINEAEEV